jgi:hypothetical protein
MLVTGVTGDVHRRHGFLPAHDEYIGDKDFYQRIYSDLMNSFLSDSDLMSLFLKGPLELL